jgi:hypothetical protein
MRSILYKFFPDRLYGWVKCASACILLPGQYPCTCPATVSTPTGVSAGAARNTAHPEAESVATTVPAGASPAQRRAWSVGCFRYEFGYRIYGVEYLGFIADSSPSASISSNRIPGARSVGLRRTHVRMAIPRNHGHFGDRIHLRVRRKRGKA